MKFLFQTLWFLAVLLVNCIQKTLIVAGPDNPTECEEGTDCLRINSILRALSLSLRSEEISTIYLADENYNLDKTALSDYHRDFPEENPNLFSDMSISSEKNLTIQGINLMDSEEPFIPTLTFKDALINIQIAFTHLIFKKINIIFMSLGLQLKANEDAFINLIKSSKSNSLLIIESSLEFRGSDSETQNQKFLKISSQYNSLAIQSCSIICSNPIYFEYFI